MALTSGTKLGPYEIQSLIGAGGMGEVYRARDTRLQRDVAVKILPSSLARDPERLRRFEQEARAVAALNHPNLLTVFDVGTAPFAAPEPAISPSDAPLQSPFIVSELLEGATLRERLASGALRERKAIDYAIQIAHGLAAAHERGIVHRDLKPDNVFVTDDGRVKILDFGLAKLTESKSSDSEATMQQSATQAGMVLGTIGYMSPEQVRGKPADSRSDIFSFGVVLYEMLAGKKAFHGDSAADVMSAILNHEPPELTATNREISPALDRIVHHCMEKTPQQRFQSAGDIAFQLAELSGIRSSTGGVSAIQGGAATRPNWLLPGIAALAGVLLLAATWFVARSTAHRAPPKFTQLTFQQGYVDSARFLPDGQSILCAAKWGSDADFSLFTARLDSQGIRPLGADADWLASVSANGDLLILQNKHPIGPGYATVGTLARLSLGGGAPKPILDSVQYADWAPDGKDFAIVRFVPETHVYRLEYPVGKVLYQTEGWISDPRFSRDGKYIAFDDHPAFGDDLGWVAVVDLAGNKKVLSGKYSSAQGLAWSPKGDEIWFSAVDVGVYRSLYATTMSGKVRSLLSVPGNVDIQDVRPDGRVLLGDVNLRLVLMVSTPGSNKERDFTWMDWTSFIHFSRDGQQILFGDQHSGPLYGTFLRNMDGSPAVRLGDGDPLDISDDGKWVISLPQTSPHQLLLLPTGAGEPRLLTNNKIDHQDGRFLPDGRFVVRGNEPGHRERTYLVDQNGNETALTPEGIVSLAVSPDGKEILTRDLESGKYGLLALNGGATRGLPQLQDTDRPFDFTADGGAVLLRRVGVDNSSEIWRADLASGKRTLLRAVSFTAVTSITGRAVAIMSRDEKNYAYRYALRSSSEYLVEGLQ